MNYKYLFKFHIPGPQPGPTQSEPLGMELKLSSSSFSLVFKLLETPDTRSPQTPQLPPPNLSPHFFKSLLKRPKAPEGEMVEVAS